MARIIMGVMGDAYGHLSQALALAESAPQHEYLFLGGGRVREVAQFGYPQLDLPMPATFYADNRVDVAVTVKNAVKVLFERTSSIRKVLDAIEAFSPSLAVTAFEYFTPGIAKELGIRTISLDNHHFLTKLKLELPPGQGISRFLYWSTLKFLYSNADHYFVSSFYGLPCRNPLTTDVFPPILRSDVKSLHPGDGDHVLVYQTSPTFEKLIPALEQSSNRFIVYGLGEKAGRRNIVFRPPSRTTLLEDLAACRYVISNGGFNLISEALFLGKPVLSFPIHLAYEQYFNAYMIKKLGYGDCSLDEVPGASTLARFEERLPEYRKNIGRGEFCGNEKISARLQEMIEDRRFMNRAAW